MTGRAFGRIRNLWALAIVLAAICAQAHAEPVVATAQSAEQPFVEATVPASIGSTQDAASGAVTARGGLTESVLDDPDAPGGYVRLVPSPDASRPMLVFELQPGLNPGQFGELSAWIRANGEDEVIHLRWLALDGDSRTVWQRRFEVRANQPFQQVVCPLWQWRWGNTALSDWSDVRYLALRVEGTLQSLSVNDVLLAPGTPAAGKMPTARWLCDLAFGQRKYRAAANAGILVATDAVDDVSEAQLQAMCSRVGVVRDWLVSTCSQGAGRPVNRRAPVPLLIFHDRRHYLDLFESLGKHWRVEIDPPDSAGYTVQDIAASTWSDRHGVDRPVFLHEATHALAARYLRLPNGVPEHTWLHEGLANYIQLIAYPSSLDSRTYRQNFAKPIEASGRGFFVPLASIMGKPVAPRNYAQLASLIAFLAEKHPDWLEYFVSAAARGDPLDMAFELCGTDAEALEKLWYAWGQENFSPAAVATREGHFNPPSGLKRLAPPQAQPTAQAAQATKTTPRPLVAAGR